MPLCNYLGTNRAARTSDHFALKRRGHDLSCLRTDELPRSNQDPLDGQLDKPSTQTSTQALSTSLDSAWQGLDGKVGAFHENSTPGMKRRGLRPGTSPHGGVQQFPSHYNSWLLEVA